MRGDPGETESAFPGERPYEDFRSRGPIHCDFGTLPYPLKLARDLGSSSSDLVRSDLVVAGSAAG